MTTRSILGVFAHPDDESIATGGTICRAVAEGHRVVLEHVGLFADGVAVRRVGEETFRLAQKYVDEVVLVSTDEICAAIQDIFEDNRTIAEPAGDRIPEDRERPEGHRERRERGRRPAALRLQELGDELERRLDARARQAAEQRDGERAPRVTPQQRELLSAGLPTRHFGLGCRVPPGRVAS